MQEKYLIPVSIFISTIVLIISFYFITNNKINEYEKVKKEAVKREDKIEIVSGDDHIFGSKNAEIYLISYSDLECPHCKKYYFLEKKLREKYRDNRNVGFVFRHYPLYKKIGNRQALHPSAGVEAVATECAQKLGGEDNFWKMLEKIFNISKSNGLFPVKELPVLAEELGLNSVDFQNCLKDESVNKKVEQDYNTAKKHGVLGTPTIFIQTSLDGMSYKVPANLQKIDKIIQLFLKQN